MPVPVHATGPELDAITDAVSAAFADDPVQQWLFAPAADAHAGRRALFQLLVEDYYWLGHLYVTEASGAITGAAMWAPPGRDAIHGDARLQDMLGALVPHLGDDVARIGELGRAHEYRPAEPHLYLGILGVHPDRQSQGIGAALIAPMLQECDRMGLLAHLESSNPENIPFYERHGFVVVDSYRCGGDGALMTMMSRRPNR